MLSANKGKREIVYYCNVMYRQNASSIWLARSDVPSSRNEWTVCKRDSSKSVSHDLSLMWAANSEDLNSLDLIDSISHASGSQA